MNWITVPTGICGAITHIRVDLIEGILDQGEGHNFRTIYYGERNACETSLTVEEIKKLIEVPGERWSITTVPLAHHIDSEQVTFKRSRNLPGNALSQLADAVTAWSTTRKT